MGSCSLQNLFLILSIIFWCLFCDISKRICNSVHIIGETGPLIQALFLCSGAGAELKEQSDRFEYADFFGSLPVKCWFSLFQNKMLQLRELRAKNTNGLKKWLQSNFQSVNQSMNYYIFNINLTVVSNLAPGGWK